MSPTSALIIDDNSKNLNILAQLLSKQGVNATTVSHPNQLPAALETLRRVDVVFLDLEMPGKDGFEVCEMLRSDPQFEGVPIVAYSVHVSEINTAYQRGFDGFLGKPLDADKFPDQLARILKGEPVWEAF